jgi:hypothetical protein
MNLLMLKQMPLERLREAAAKDKWEVMQKRREYDGFLDWTDRGIVDDLARMYNICNLALSLLLPIVTNMSARIGVPLGCQEKRRRDLLLAWINKHYDQIRGFVPRLVFRNKAGGMTGTCADEWSRSREHNPTPDCWLRNDLLIGTPIDKDDRE